jgi:hypothetical protein
MCKLPEVLVNFVVNGDKKLRGRTDLMRQEDKLLLFTVDGE